MKGEAAVGVSGGGEAGILVQEGLYGLRCWNELLISLSVR